MVDGLWLAEEATDLWIRIRKSTGYASMGELLKASTRETLSTPFT